MAINSFDQKLEILSFLLFQYGKLIKLAVILEQQGLDSTDARKREKEASKEIDRLRGDMLRTWNGQAAALMTDLRAINESAQRKVRELQNAVDKVKKVASILGEIDRALTLVRGL